MSDRIFAGVRLKGAFVNPLFDLGAELDEHVNFVTLEIDGAEQRCINILVQTIAGSPIRPYSRRWVYLAAGGKIVMKREVFRQGLDEPPVTGTTVVSWEQLTPKLRGVFERATAAQAQHFTALKGMLSA